MNIRTVLMWGGILVLLLQSACQSPTEPEDESVSKATHLKGSVLRGDNLSAVANAIVVDTKGAPRDTSKSDGSFSLRYDLTTQYQGTVIAQKSGFGSDTVNFSLKPGVDSIGVSLVLQADSASPIPGVSSGKAASIILIGSTGENISIRGTGSNETAVLTFEARDSLGIAVAGTNKLSINFSILGGPGGGEYVFPVSGETDPVTGRVTTRVTSGTKAGVLQVYASATVNGVKINSSPIRITIAGGLPVAGSFSLSRTRANIAGGVFDNLRSRIQVIVGDKYGNPVQSGTAVYFTTTGGIVQPSAVTDNDGIAGVDLISGNPRPANSAAIVTATTIGDSGVRISRNISVVFSGPTTILGPASTVVIPDSGVNQFSYRVQDPSGYPLVGGTGITVSVEGPGATDLELFGDKEKTMEDTDDPRNTLFNVTVRDKKYGGGGQVTFKIKVTSENGNLSYTFPGFVSSDTSQVPTPPPISSTSGYASSLTVVSVSTSQVSVRGTGANETSKLTFVARDSAGNSIDITKKAYVTFQISPAGGLGGGEFLSPTADSTNSSGQVSTTFNAGTKAGVVQIIARATVLGRTITSSPVRVTIAGGLPVEERFSISRGKVNIAGGVFDNLRNRIQVIVGDKDGNPVQTGTAISFTSTGGIIQPSALTSVDGIAAVELISGNPRPLGGIAVVTAKTIGDGGTSISKSVPVVFSGATRIIAPTTTFEVADSGEYSFAYKVQDANGNPLTAGTGISVTVSGIGAGDLEVTGDNSVTLPDTDDPRYTSFVATVRDKRTGGSSGPVTVKINVTSENGNAVHTFAGSVRPGVDIISPPPSAREPAQITVSGPSATAIDIAGVGGLENSIVTYTVKDSLGTPIDKTKRTYVQFQIDFFPNSFVGGGTPPRVIPGADSTDNSGVVRASVVSGTQAGVVKLIARVNLGGKELLSEPVRITVRAGDPTQSHFTFATDSYAFATVPGGLGPTFMVQVADTFSNPVATGTAVYFHTWAGNIQGTTTTDANGRGNVLFLGGNPEPSASGTTLAGRQTFYQREGILWVVAQTAGKSGKKIADSLRVCWSVNPITVTGIPVADVGIPQNGSSAPISISVRDGRNNPLPVGTKISVTISFTSDLSGIKFGSFGDLSDEIPFIMPNAPYVVDPGSGVTDFTFRVADLSNPSAPVGQRVVIKVTIEAPNMGGARTFSFGGVVQ